MTTEQMIEETAMKLKKAGAQKAEWFEPDAEVILVSSVKMIVRKSLEEVVAQERKRITSILTREHYGLSYEADTCIECSNHLRIEEAITPNQEIK